MIYCGDCCEVLKTLSDNSIDAVITDPPYELGFMSKGWDKTGIAYNVEMWSEVLRVLKPGGHLLSYGGARTYHRMACAIEDAGFEIRDMINWVYGQGFPKSLSVGKAIDKLQGNARAIVGKTEHSKKDFKNNLYAQDPANRNNNKVFGYGEEILTKGNSEWEGWGTGLKPAHEPIVLARKPLSEKTIAENVLKWGTGAINIDGCRIPYEEGGTAASNPKYRVEHGYKLPPHQGGGIIGTIYSNPLAQKEMVEKGGRFPANLIHDGSDEVLAEFAKAGVSPSSWRKAQPDRAYPDALFPQPAKDRDERGHNDSGTPARFFYCAKASRSERDAGLEDMPLGEPPASARSKPAEGRKNALGEPRHNFHPTVKPISLLTYLIKLITPPNGIILDPFMGSGSTLVAAKQLGYKSIGIELNKDYYDIAQRRIDAID